VRDARRATRHIFQCPPTALLFVCLFITPCWLACCTTKTLTHHQHQHHRSSLLVAESLATDRTAALATTTTQVQVHAGDMQEATRSNSRNAHLAATTKTHAELHSKQQAAQHSTATATALLTTNCQSANVGRWPTLGACAAPALGTTSCITNPWSSPLHNTPP
jgi:hypothetical protein